MLKATKRILFITQWEYQDGLIQSTLSYLNIIERITGYYCYLVTTSKVSNKIRVAKRGRMIMIEVPVKRRWLFLSWFYNIILLKGISDKKKVDIVHGWCTPACSVALMLKLMNRKLKFIADSYEPHSESMVETGAWKRKNFKFYVLFFLERIQTRNADCFIFSAPGMEDYILKKYHKKVSNFLVKPTCANLERFSYSAVKNPELLEKYKLKDKITCVYAGKLGGLYLYDEIFAFIKKCEDYWGSDNFRFLLLSGATNDEVNEVRKRYRISSATIIKQFVPHTEIQIYMGLADFGFSPVKPVPSRKYCSPIKDAEYWALGLPTVITHDISIDSGLIRNNNIGAVIESLDDKGYLVAIKKVDEILKQYTRQEIYNKIRPFAEKYRNMNIAEDVYSTVYTPSVV